MKLFLILSSIYCLALWGGIIVIIFDIKKDVEEINDLIRERKESRM